MAWKRAYSGWFPGDVKIISPAQLGGLVEQVARGPFYVCFDHNCGSRYTIPHNPKRDSRSVQSMLKMLKLNRQIEKETIKWARRLYESPTAEDKRRVWFVKKPVYTRYKGKRILMSKLPFERYFHDIRGEAGYHEPMMSLYRELQSPLLANISASAALRYLAYKGRIDGGRYHVTYQRDDNLRYR